MENWFERHKPIAGLLAVGIVILVWTFWLTSGPQLIAVPTGTYVHEDDPVMQEFFFQMSSAQKGMVKIGSEYWAIEAQAYSVSRKESGSRPIQCVRYEVTHDLRNLTESGNLCFDREARRWKFTPPIAKPISA
jgi:hypothetical protein